MARPYYVLLVRDCSDGGNGDWTIEFGDYDRDCVADELDDCVEGYRSIPRRWCKIVRVPSDTQEAIDKAVMALNAPR